MDRLKFDKSKHIYTLDDKPITGVTTILGVISKPALIGWAANQAVDYIIKNSDVNNYANRDIGAMTYILTHISVLEEARRAYAKKRDKAGDTGTLCHKMIEEWIKTGKKPQKYPDTQVKKMVLNFINWAKENKVKFLASEKQVYSEKYFFAGTYDFLCEIDGKTWLGDIKTSSNIYPEMMFQCAAYQICEEEMNKIKIDGCIVVNISKNGKLKEKRSISNKTNKEAFLAALKLYRAINKVSSSVLQQ